MSLLEEEALLAKALKQPSAEPLACSVRPATIVIHSGARSGTRLSGRGPARRCTPALDRALVRERHILRRNNEPTPPPLFSVSKNHTPNQTPEPTSPLGTSAAGQPRVPIGAVAHLERSAKNIMNSPINYFPARALIGDDGRTKIWCQASEVSCIKNALGRHAIDPESIDVFCSKYRYVEKDEKIVREETPDLVEIDLGKLPLDKASFVVDDLVKLIRPYFPKK